MATTAANASATFFIGIIPKATLMSGCTIARFSMLAVTRKPQPAGNGAMDQVFSPQDPKRLMPLPKTTWDFPHSSAFRERKACKRWPERRDLAGGKLYRSLRKRGRFGALPHSEAVKRSERPLRGGPISGSGPTTASQARPAQEAQETSAIIRQIQLNVLISSTASLCDALCLQTSSAQRRFF